ncbi:MAG: STN domain-containing protein [Armatimonadota bacterium]|nr:STN domain-containing protein [bacterium]
MRSVCVALLVSVVILSAIAVAFGAPFRGKSALVDLDLKNVTVEEGISALFAGSGYKYTIAPGVSGKIVELKLKGITFEEALKAFASAAEFTYTVMDGVYTIKSSQTISRSSTNIVVQGSPRHSVPAKSVPYPSQQQAVQANQQMAQSAQPAEVASGPAAPSQQVVVNQHAPVFYGQPSYNPGYYGYPPNFYRFGNLGILGGCGGATVLGGFGQSILTFGPVPPVPGWVGPDLERFFRTIQVITSRPYFSGYGY